MHHAWMIGRLGGEFVTAINRLKLVVFPPFFLQLELHCQNQITSSHDLRQDRRMVQCCTNCIKSAMYILYQYSLLSSQFIPCSTLKNCQKKRAEETVYLIELQAHIVAARLGTALVEEECIELELHEVTGIAHDTEVEGLKGAPISGADSLQVLPSLTPKGT